MDPFVIALVAVSRRPARRLERPAQDGRRPAPGGDGRDAGGVGRHRAGSGSPSWWLAGPSALPVEGIALGIASGVVEAAYFILLSAAYRRGDLSVVYPIARGTAPLLAVAIGVGLLGERLGRRGVDRGRRCCWPGSCVLQRPWRALALAAGAARRAPASRGKAAADSAILFALATGVTIATYTAIDRVGTRLIDPLAVRRDPVGDVRRSRSSLWVRVRGRRRPAARRAGGGPTRRGRRLADARRVPAASCARSAWRRCRASRRCASRRRSSPRPGARSGWARRADRSETVRRIGASVLIVGGALLLAMAS